jgi:hypothetical protein
MWTKIDDLRFCVKMGLRKGLARIRGLRRALTDDEQDTVAKEIVEHLELSNWKIEPGEPLRGHGQGIIPKLDEGDGE